MKVALVTTCKGRRAHVEMTLPRNIADNTDPDSVFVLLDYNSEDDLSEYVFRNHRADLDSGRLVYYRNQEPRLFRMAHAKNQAHRCGLLEGAQILVNLDADNWAGRELSRYVRSRFSAAEDDCEAIFLGTRGNFRGPGRLISVRTPSGCSGRIAVSKQAFIHTGGYDEVFRTWSPDDKDFGMRLGNLGYSWRQIRPCFLHAIEHGDSVRFSGYEEPPLISESDETGILAGRAHLGVVNGGRIGAGLVYRNFSPSPTEIRPIPTRIFGVGLHKTGTTSLTEAFRLMGFDSAHWESPNWARYIWQEMRAGGRSRTLEMHYALSDLPIPLLYRELDKAYPGSKFILTVRDENEWIESISKHWIGNRARWDQDNFSHEVHISTYGTKEFDELIFRNRYRRHNREIMDHFKGREDDLFVLNVAKCRSMASLCRFLGVDILDTPFPHLNRWE